MAQIEMKLLLLMCLLGLLSACSTTTSDARQYLVNASNAKISSSALHVDRSQLILASQEGGGLYELHHSSLEVGQMFANVASKFGFRKASPEEATYVAKLISAFPDGGACEGLGDAASDGASYTASVLTFGILPASGSHCYLVALELYERIGGELLLVGEFFANNGRVDVYAGANEIESYSLIVTRRDEVLALETSIAALFRQMILDGAFE